METASLHQFVHGRGKWVKRRLRMGMGRGSYRSGEGEVRHNEEQT